MGSVAGVCMYVAARLRSPFVYALLTSIFVMSRSRAAASEQFILNRRSSATVDDVFSKCGRPRASIIEPHRAASKACRDLYQINRGF